MSVDGESLAFDENVDAEHDVDPDDVDWFRIFDEHAGSDGVLDGSTRVDVIGSEVDGIENSRQAESLLNDAASEGHIEKRNGHYCLESVADQPVDAKSVDWHAVFESVAGGIGKPLPSSEIKRSLSIKGELGLETEDQAAELVTNAIDRGIVVGIEVNDTREYYLADGLEEADVSPVESQPEPTGSGSGRSERPEEESSETARPEPSSMERGELESEVQDLRKQVDGMEKRFDAMSSRMDTFVEAVFGEDTVPGDVEKSEDMLTKFADLRGRVDEHDEKLSMVSSEGGNRSTPDERAMGLRTSLYEEAKNSPEKSAVMSRDQAKFALNGGLSRPQLLDAMRRAADGDTGNINGSSDLEPVDGLEFVSGGGRDRQSKIRLNIAETSGESLRTNITDS